MFTSFCIKYKFARPHFTWDQHVCWSSRAFIPYVFQHLPSQTANSTPQNHPKQPRSATGWGLLDVIGLGIAVVQDRDAAAQGVLRQRCRLLNPFEGLGRWEVALNLSRKSPSLKIGHSLPSIFYRPRHHLQRESHRRPPRKPRRRVESSSPDRSPARNAKRRKTPRDAAGRGPPVTSSLAADLRSKELKNQESPVKPNQFKTTKKPVENTRKLLENHKETSRH